MSFNISLNQPDQQSAYPFFSLRLTPEIFQEIKENQHDLELKTSTKNNQFQLKIGDKTYSSTGYPEKCVDVLKYSAQAGSYIHVGPIHTKLSVELEMTKSHANRIREETKVSNVRETKSKLLEDNIPNGNGKKRKREKSPAPMNKRIKKDSTSTGRSNSRSPRAVSNTSKTSTSSTSTTTSKPKNPMGMQIPKKSKRSPPSNDSKIEADLGHIAVCGLLDDAQLRGVNMELKESPTRSITKINSRKEFQTLWNQYQSLHGDYLKMYRVVHSNDALFDRLFQMHASAESEALKEKIESKIHQLHDVRQNDQKKLAKKYNLVHEELKHLRKLLESFRQ